MATELKKISSRLASIDVTLAKQAVVLEEHISRTNALEEKVEAHTELMAEFKGAIRFVKLIGILAGIAEAVSQVLRHI